MKRSKILYNHKNEAIGVIYFQLDRNLVGCGVYLKSALQKRPLNIEVATLYAKKRALNILIDKKQGYEHLTTLSTVIDLKKSQLSFQKLWELSRVVVEDNHPYIMF